MTYEFFINGCVRSLLIVNAEYSASLDEARQHLGLRAEELPDVETGNQRDVIFRKCLLGQIPIIIRRELPKEDLSRAEFRTLMRWSEQVAEQISRKLAPENVINAQEGRSYEEQISDEIQEALDNFLKEHKAEEASRKRSLGILLSDFKKAANQTPEDTELKKQLDTVISEAETKKTKEEVVGIITKALEKPEVKAAIDHIQSERHQQVQKG